MVDILFFYFVLMTKSQVMDKGDKSKYLIDDIPYSMYDASTPARVIISNK